MRRSRHALGRLAAAICLVLATPHCSREAGPGTAANSFTVDPQPILVLRSTTAGGEVLFGIPRGAARLSSGEIAVAEGNPTTPAIVFFDTQGRRVRAVGRSGAGPGEYRTISWLKQCGPDTLYVYDIWLKRVAVLRGDGEFVREFATPTYAHLAGCARSGLLAILGTYAMDAPASPRFRSATGPLLLADSRGNELRNLGPVLAFDLVLTDFAGWQPRLASRIPSVAVAHDRLYVGPSDSSAILVFLLEGRRLPSLPVLRAPREPGRRHLEAAADYMVSFGPAGELRNRMRRRFLGVAPADRLPAFSTLSVDPDGVLWANLSVPGDTVTVLRAFGVAGEVLGDVRLPVALTVFEVGTDYVLGALGDEAREPVVAVYRLHRGR